VSLEKNEKKSENNLNITTTHGVHKSKGSNSLGISKEDFKQFMKRWKERYITEERENTPAIDKFNETERLKSEIRYLKDLNTILAKTNNKLVNEYSEIISDLKEEVRKLRDKINFIQKERKIQYILPESWIEEE
jgi:hypothetical protein